MIKNGRRFKLWVICPECNKRKNAYATLNPDYIGDSLFTFKCEKCDQKVVSGGYQILEEVPVLPRRQQLEVQQ